MIDNDSRTTDSNMRGYHRNTKDFKLRKGDLIKGIESDEIILYKILQNGVNCREFLGSATLEEKTNLDVEFSMVTEEEQIMGDSNSKENLWIVIKNNEEKFNNWVIFRNFTIVQSRSI